MTKYVPGRRVTVQEFKKVPEKKIDWDAIGGVIVLFFIVAAVLSNCAG
jgi:hypothetical protein